MKLDELVVGKTVLREEREELIIENRDAVVTTLRRNANNGIERVIYFYSGGKASKGVSDYPTVIIIEKLNKNHQDYDSADNELKGEGL